MHDPADEVAEPEHGRVLHPDRRLTAIHVLQGVPHGRIGVQLVLVCVHWVVRECSEGFGYNL